MSRKFLKIGRQTETKDGSEEDRLADHRQNNVNNITNVEHERDYGYVMKELLAVAQIQGEANSADHNVIGKVGGVENLAHC